MTKRASLTLANYGCHAAYQCASVDRFDDSELVRWCHPRPIPQRQLRSQAFFPTSGTVRKNL